MNNALSSKPAILARSIAALLVGGMLLTHFTAPSASAATYYWDNDGTTAGFGTAAGTWAAPTIGDATQGWSTSTTGVLLPAEVTTVTTDVLNFGNTTTGLAAGTITVSGTVDAGNMTFASGLGAIVLSGGTINLADAETITVNNAANTIGSTLTGAGTSLTKAGTGEVFLTGTNTSFTGAVNINAGTLALKNTAALGSTSGIKMANGTALRFSGAALGTFDYALPISITSGAATIRSFDGLNETFNLGSVISGSGGLTFNNGSNGNVTLNFVLQQANTYRGNTTISAIAGGSIAVKLGIANALPTTTVVTINQGAGSNGSGRSATLDLAGFNQTIAGLVSTNVNQFESAIVRNTGGAATLTINNSSDRTFTGKIQQTGIVSLVKTGSGTQTLAGNNSYTGATTVNGGILALDFTQFGSSLTNAPGNYISVSSVLELGGGNFSVTGRANGSAVASAGWTGGVTNSPVITFATLPAGLVVGQAITGTSIGTATYVAGIDTANKKVSLNQNVGAASGTIAAIATAVATSQTFASTTLGAGASGLSINASSGNGTLVALNAITRNVGGTVNFTQPAGPISATNGFTTSTANTAGTILGGWATVGGTDWATNDGANIVALGSYTLTSVAGTTAGSYTSNNIDVDNSAGTLDGVITANSLRFNTATANTVTLAAGTSTITSGGVLVGSAVGNNLSTITGGTLQGASGQELIVNQHNTGNSLTIDSIIADNTTATGLTKSGAGTLVLSNKNTYTGATILNTGTLSVGSSNNLGDAAASLVFNGGTLEVTGTVLASISSLGRTVSFNPAKTVGLTINSAAHTFTVDQVLNQTTGGFTKAGAGTAVLSQANTYTGTTTVSAGTLTLSGSGTLGNGANLTLSGGQLDLGITGQTVGAVSVSAAAASGNTISNGSLTGTSYAASNTTGNAIISASLLVNGVAGFTKSGAGTVILSGTNTYTGATTISGGVLRLDSASALGSGNLSLSSGVLGLGAGNLTLTAGTTAGTYQLNGGGFAAYGGNRSVAFAATTNWNTTGLTGTLLLSAADSDSTITLTSAISQAGGVRTIQVADGSAAIDAVMSGGFTSNAGGLTKTGTGTLALTANSLYTGATLISAGTLMLGNGTGNTGNLNSTASISVSAGATLAVNRTGAVSQGATFAVPVLISGAGSFAQVGSGTTTLSLANTYTGVTTVNNGTLNINGSLGAGANVVNANAGATNFGVSQTLAALNVGPGAVVTLGTLPPAPLAASAAPGFDGIDASGGPGANVDPEFDSINGAASFAANAGQAVPEPGAIALLLAGVLGLARRRRRET